MAIEVTVQIPFVGADALQAVFGGVAVLFGVLGIHARRAAWR
jgi:hypothetical protein